MIAAPRLTARNLGKLFVLAVVYFIAAKLGLRLAFVHASSTAVWPPTGLSIAAVLILGHEIWPAIFAGAFTANLLTAGTVATSVGIGAGNTLEALLGAFLVNRFAGGRNAFDRPENVIRFAVLACLLGTMVSPTIGVTTLSLGGVASWASYGPIWITWWLGDATGALLWTPAVVLWCTRPKPWWPRRGLVESVALFAVVLATAGLVFGGFFPSPVQNYPLEFLCLPPLLWAAFRFDPREAATALIVLANTAVAGTLFRFGPFARSTPNESLLLLQTYVGVATLTTLVLAAVVAERRRLEGELRRLSVTDALTGIANYRLLVERLGSELARSMRSGRTFALLLLDVDGLKRINDRFGHLTGSRALCRVADALRAASRATDTPARYGGDEFALVLPETDEAGAKGIGSRVTEALARDGEQPPVTVSLGISIFPDHGESAEALLSEADARLYEMKAQGRRRRAGDHETREELR